MAGGRAVQCIQALRDLQTSATSTTEERSQAAAILAQVERTLDGVKDLTERTRISARRTVVLNAIAVVAELRIPRCSRTWRSAGSSTRISWQCTSRR